MTDPRAAPADRVSRRLFLLGGVSGAALLALGGRLFQVQVMQHDALAAEAEEQRRREAVIPAPRGSIRDREGRLLATSVDGRSIFADPSLVADAPAVAAALAPVLGVPAGDLLERLAGTGRFVYLARLVPDAAADSALAFGYPGIGEVTEPRRVYPSASLAANVLGFVGADHVGLEGLEAQYDALLGGEPGLLSVERDPAGRQIPEAGREVVPAVAGESLDLTLDREIQWQAERALAAQVAATGAVGGHLVVMEPATGAILAMANVPSFDPNEFGHAAAEERRNRAIADLYEPGSTFKVVAIAGALEAGVVSGGTVLEVPDRITLYPGTDDEKTYKDFTAHETLNLTVSEIVARSSNVGTIKIAQALGDEALAEWISHFGFGAATGVDLPGEAAGIVPDVRDGNQWTGLSIASIPIGYSVAVTAVQMARVFAAIANGGTLVQPHVVAGSVDADGIAHEHTPPPGPAVLSANIATSLRAMLLGVVNSEEGTGGAAAIPGYQVAGKTGTSRKVDPVNGGYSDQYLASFVGFTPVDDPALVVAVVLDSPRGDQYTGGVVAAPVFAEVTAFALSQLGVLPTGSGVSGTDE